MKFNPRKNYFLPYYPTKLEWDLRELECSNGMELRGYRDGMVVRVEIPMSSFLKDEAGTKKRIAAFIKEKEEIFNSPLFKALYEK